MSAKNYRRGTTFEREVVDQAKEQGLKAQRAWGSNGRALGEVKEVDVVVSGQRGSLKRRKKLPAYLQLPDGVDFMAFRQDKGEAMVQMPLKKWLEWLSRMTSLMSPQT